MGWPLLLDDDSRVIAHHRFQPAAHRLGVAVEIAIEAGHRRRLRRDDTINFRVVLPGRNGDQAECQSVEDPHAREEETHDVVMLGRAAHQPSNKRTA